MRVVFMGTGTSHGVPVPGCGCAVCGSTDPRDRRYRSGILVEGREGERVVIDTGPEFRLEALAAGLSRLDAVFVTHAHADHLHGLDDVRVFCRERPLPLFADAATLSEVRERFGYVWRDGQEGGGKPRLEPRVVPAAGVAVGKLRVTPVPVLHGALPISGFRVGGFALLTDCSAIPEASYGLLGGLDVLAIGALRRRRHETHFSFDEALEAAARIGAAKTFLLHLSHSTSHREAEAICAASGLAAAPAYDGLAVELPD